MADILDDFNAIHRASIPNVVPHRERQEGGAKPATSTDTAKPRVLPLVFFADIQPDLEARDFVQGVLAERTGVVVYGESNSGKTFFVTDLALHIAAGKRWNGRRVEQGGVVYCVLEGGRGFHNRVAVWRTKEAIEDASIPFAAIPSALNLLDPDADTVPLIVRIKDAAAAFEMPVKLIVIDTLSRALAGGNENAPDDMGALVTNMDRIREETGACVLFVHHSGKDQARGARGHSLLRAAVDTEIEVKAEDQSERRTAEVVKQRDMAKGDVFAFTLGRVVLEQNVHKEDVTSCVVCPEQAPVEGSQRKREPTGDAGMALRVLNDAIAESGDVGCPGVPSGLPSIPEAWWRERFYSRAKPGASQDTKQKAFRRAADTLVEIGRAAANKDRVWAP